MIRRFSIGAFSIATVFFFILSLQRLTMDYNEEGVYFDGVATHDSDAIVGYTTLAIISFLITFGLMLIKKSQSRY